MSWKALTVHAEQAVSFQATKMLCSFWLQLALLLVTHSLIQGCETKCLHLFSLTVHKVGNLSRLVCLSVPVCRAKMCN